VDDPAAASANQVKARSRWRLRVSSEVVARARPVDPADAPEQPEPLPDPQRQLPGMRPAGFRRRHAARAAGVDLAAAHSCPAQMPRTSSAATGFFTP